MRIYFKILKILALLTVIMAIPALPLALLFLTGGLSIALCFVATAFLYWMCLLPLALLWKQNRVTGAVGAVVMCFAAAVLPYEFMKSDAVRIFDEITISNVSSSLPVTSKTLEIVKKSYGKFFSSREPCGPECKGLLLSGKVNWIRHIDHSGRETRNAFFKAATGDECGVGAITSNENICVLPAPDNGTQAELQIVYENRFLDGNRTENESLTDLEQVSVYELGDGNHTLIYRQSSPIVPLPMRPTVIVANLTTEGWYGILRRNTAYNAVALDQTLSDLGYEFTNTGSSWR